MDETALVASVMVLISSCMIVVVKPYLDTGDGGKGRPSPIL